MEIARNSEALHMVQPYINLLAVISSVPSFGKLRFHTSTYGNICWGKRVCPKFWSMTKSSAEETVFFGIWNVEEVFNLSDHNPFSSRRNLGLFERCCFPKAKQYFSLHHGVEIQPSSMSHACFYWPIQYVSRGNVVTLVTATYFLSSLSTASFYLPNST